MTEDLRFQQLVRWVEELAQQRGWQVTAPAQPASSDASFRRYFRIGLDGVSHIVMDAPPAHEDCAPFVRIAGWLRAMGLNVPQVLAWHEAEGFVLLSDLGQTDYQQALNAETADALYGDALSALVRMQTAGAAYLDALPPYDEALLRSEMALFSDWLVQRHLNLSLPESWAPATDALVASALAQPRVFVHRDYHSRNLMVSTPNPGILDFQDAVAGPLTYDAVSLLRDCYVRWPETQVTRWRDQWFDQLVAAGLQRREDHDAFVRAFDLMGVQRHLKAAGIFVRLWLRDGKPRYLADVPNTLRYIAEAGARWPETATLARWVAEEVMPAWEQAA